MADIQLGAHTVRSHGVKLARFHMHDWIILVLLVVIDVILNVIDPFYRFVGKDMMTDLRYPLKSNTVPFWAVPVIAVLLPFVIIIGFYFLRRNVYDLHNAILGILFSVLITAVLTDAIKDAVGRPRPDFFWRCFPDGKAFYDPVTTDVICHGEKSVIKEGHKSFPSGHSSYHIIIDAIIATKNTDLILPGVAVTATPSGKVGGHISKQLRLSSKMMLMCPLISAQGVAEPASQ